MHLYAALCCPNSEHTDFITLHFVELWLFSLSYCPYKIWVRDLKSKPYIFLFQLVSSAIHNVDACAYIKYRLFLISFISRKTRMIATNGSANPNFFSYI